MRTCAAVCGVALLPKLSWFKLIVEGLVFPGGKTSPSTIHPLIIGTGRLGLLETQTAIELSFPPTALPADGAIAKSHSTQNRCCVLPPPRVTGVGEGLGLYICMK